MDKLAHYFSTHPLAVIAVTFFVFLIIYFLFKKLVKLALLFFLILLAIGGYFYFKYPEKKVFENMSQAVQKARSQTGKVVEKGKNAYQKGKGIYEKGKKLTRDLFPEKGEETDRQE